MKNLIYIILTFILAACSTTRTIEVPVETVKTEYVNKVDVRHDSIYLKDSINIYHKGDTVLIEKCQYKYKYKDRVITDTICKIDSILVPVYIETTKEVNRIKWYQSLLMYCGIGALAILAFTIYKRIRKIKI